MRTLSKEISIQAHDFDLSTEVQALRAGSGAVGAIATFTGLMRDINDGNRVTAMELEHYPGMTEKSIAAIIAEAKQRWTILAVKVIHRIGRLAPGDQIVYVGVASMHRGDAFAACEFIMDYLKTRAPFWKKESTPSGERWVDARCTDQNAADRWQQ